MANEQFNNAEWCLQALIDLGNRFGHERMRKIAKEAMRKRGAKMLSQLGSSEYLPVFNEVKSALSNEYSGVDSKMKQD